MMSVFRYPSSLPWGEMLSESGVNELSDFLYNVGKAAKTEYTATSSNAKPGDQLHALVEKYGYDKDMILVNRDCVTEEEWERMIRNELDEGRPVMMSSRDAAYGGHSFIIDGYSDNGYHVNWGWSGSHNGYYRLDALTPDIYNFCNDQRVFIGCKPDDGKQTIENYLQVNCNLSETEMNSSDVDDGKRITLKVTVQNHSYYPFKGFYYIYYVSEDGTRTQASSYKNYVLTTLTTDHYTTDEIKLSPPSKPGRYTLAMRASQQLDYKFCDMALSGTTSFTIHPSTTDIQKTVINVDDINNGNQEYYNTAGQRVAAPKRGRLIKRTRQGGQLVI